MDPDHHIMRSDEREKVKKEKKERASHIIWRAKD